MSSSPPDATWKPVFDETFREALTDLFRWRRDVRRFRPDPLDEALIAQLIDLACLAPSVGLSQPWRFVRVEDVKRRQAVQENFRRCNREALNDYHGERARLYAELKLAGLDAAPLHLAVFCDYATETGHGLGRKTMPETLAYSVVAAVHNLWLAARAWDVGVGWVSILDPDEVRECLAVPESWSLVAYLCIGYPEEAHLDPELERRGWEQRRPDEAAVLKR